MRCSSFGIVFLNYLLKLRQSLLLLTLQRGELQPLVLQQLTAADPHSSPVCVAAPDLALTTQAVKLPEALTKEEGGLLACHQHIDIVEGAGLYATQQV